MNPTESFDFMPHAPLSIRLRGELMLFDTPKVMGIINATPDSFLASSRVDGNSADIAGKMLEEGADILDIGGYSTRPGAEDVSEEEEYDRLAPVLDSIRSHFPEAIISVDTFRAEIARRVISEFHVDIINDIGGGTLDPDIIPAVAEAGVPYILMHMRGTPKTMDRLCDYGDVTADVLRELMSNVDRCHSEGIHDVIVDPGFGFAKNIMQNYRLLNDLDWFHQTGCPVLAGLSRKRMIWQPLDISSTEAGDATVCINTIALLNGADILRVHDVRPAVESVKLINLLRKAGKSTPFTINRSLND